MSDRDLYLGSALHGEGRVLLDADHLTTHAVCVGMTGSGKTGLGIVALEELARRGIPLLVVDLKGDMVDLLLNFPSLDPREFEPWLPPDAGAGPERQRAATDVAETWRAGLARSGLGEGDLRAVRNGVEWQLLTPGAGSAAPLDILPALKVPAGWNPDSDVDAATDRVNGITAALLSLVGRGGDVLADRDHVLTASVILEHWRREEDLDLDLLLRSLVDPPLEALGALPLDSFYPRDERMKLVMALNTLLASPGFAAWREGVPLQMPDLLGQPGRPKASIVSVAHLDERQRLFVIGLLVSELVAWMRRQPASSGLRSLLYMDEVQGIIPPHPANPPTKGPLLTLFKQGRAYGAGAWLATQNPVDLDYKALGNAGVKLVGRLITDRDRDRALEGLGMRKLPDGRDAAERVAALGKREFLLVDVRAEERVRSLRSRWAMSYLRGPVTLAEMGPLLAQREVGSEGRETNRDPSPTAMNQPPPLTAPAEVRFARKGSGSATPTVMVRSSVVIQRTTLELYREMHEVWNVPIDADGGLRWNEARLLQAWPDTEDEPPPQMTFPAVAPRRLSAELKTAERSFTSWRSRRPVMVLVNEDLKMAAAEGEARDLFLTRCLEVADRADDATQERARRKYEGRMRTLRARLDRERGELERDRTQLQSRQVEERMSLVEGLVSVLLGSKSISSASRKAASRMRTAAGKRRMRQSAEGAVSESEREIERLETELEELAAELEAEVARIAKESQAKAARIEEKPLKVRKTDISIHDLVLLWS